MPIVGGACVTEEIAPGCRASTTSYIASMLRPEVIRDLEPRRARPARWCPAIRRCSSRSRTGPALAWWSDRERTVRELEKLSPADARTFVRVDDELKRLARYLQPFFLEPPPDVARAGPRRASSRRCGSAGASAGISGGGDRAAWSRS